MPELLKSTSAEFLSGGGEMGERIRSFDWSRTPLGNPDDWEQSLKTCVRIMLRSSQPIWIGWGREDMIKLYNDAYIDIVRGKHPRALGEKVSVVWKDIWKDIGPMLDKAMMNDEGTYVESQLLIMHRSGYPEEVYYTFSYTPVLGDDGRPSGIICYNTADTDRIINERALKTLQQFDNLNQLKEQKDIYTNVIEALKTNNKDFPYAFIHTIESEGMLAKLAATTGVNWAAPGYSNEFHLRNENPLPATLERVVTGHKMIVSDTSIILGTVSKGGWDIEPQQFLTIPIFAVGKDRPLALLSLGLNPYRKFDDVFKNFVQQISDQITSAINNTIAFEEERKRTFALEELDRAKTIFFSNISHEFRTPLTLILGTLEDGLRDITISSTEKERVIIAHRNAMRLLKLVNTLLDFSRIESGRQKAFYVRTNLASHTRNLAGNFRSIIEKAGLQFILNIQDIMQPVYVDSQMWEMIVFNLLSNAFKFTLGGSITVNLYSNHLNAVLEVEDTGVGIPESEIPRMFERFHRVENVIGRTYEGTGIGLSLIKELVQLHGGKIEVQSKLSVGTTFRVTIPYGKKHLPPDQTTDTMIKPEELFSSLYLEEDILMLEPQMDVSVPNDNLAPNKPTILIVDDNQDMRQHIQSVMKKDFNIITAKNGMDAWQKIEVDPPALVISDIMMPVMDGNQLLKEIKQNKHTAHIPVILLTARAGEESRREGFETGADDYLVKPFSSTELLSRVKTQVKIAKTRWQLQMQLEKINAELEQKVAARTVELQNKNNELERTNRELEAFNYIASHDLQEPLRKIQTFIFLLQKSNNPDTYKKYIDKIYDSSSRMSQLIQSVLDYSRLSHPSEGFEPTDLNQILATVKNDYELSIAEKKAILKNDEFPVVNAVPLQMHQLFSNLLSNSLKFSQGHPLIEIRSAVAEKKEIEDIPGLLEGKQYVKIIFKDNGIGFDNQYKDKIFKLFQRLHNKSEYQGTGIGLSIVNKIIENHHGHIYSDSKPGEGSAFIFYLPLY